MTTAVQPVAGDFGLTSITGNVGTLIKFGQWLNGDGFTDYEHAFVYVGGGMIVEAEPGGARLTSLDEYDHRWVKWSTGHIDLTLGQRSKIVQAANGQVGVPYSALDYFALAAHRLHIPAPGLRGYIDNSGHQICSQLVDWCYRQAGVQLFADGRWSGYVTPGSLNKLLK